MSDWLSELDDAERGQWDEFVEHFRRTSVEGITDSAAFISLLPAGEPDIRFCAELGVAIMLDKPIIAVALNGRSVPPMLRRLAAEVVEADIDTEAGRDDLAAAVVRVVGEEK